MDTQEQDFLAFAFEAAESRPDRVAVLFDLSGIPHIEDAVFFRVLRRRIDQQVAGVPHTTFHLPHHLLCFIAGREPAERLLQVGEGIRSFLAAAGRGSLEWTSYDLTRQSADLLARANAIAEEAGKRVSPELSNDADMSVWMEIHGALVHADIANLVRERVMWSFADPAAPVEVAHALSIDLPEIEEMFDANLHDNPWLFDHIMETLDVRLLDHVVEVRTARGFRVSINVHAAAVLNHDLDALVARMQKSRRVNIIAELPYVEALNDEERFWETVTALRGFDFEVALDGVPWTSLPHIQLNPARFAFIKIVWTPEMMSLGPSRLMELRDAVARLGAERCMLYRIPDDAALHLGMSLGMHLFQGAAADAAARKATNVKAAGPA